MLPGGEAGTSPIVCTLRTNVAMTVHKQVHTKRSGISEFVVAGNVCKSGAHDATLKIGVILFMFHEGTNSNKLNFVHHVAGTNFCPRNRTVKLATCFNMSSLQVLT